MTEECDLRLIFLFLSLSKNEIYEYYVWFCFFFSEHCPNYIIWKKKKTILRESLNTNKFELNQRKTLRKKNNRKKMADDYRQENKGETDNKVQRTNTEFSTINSYLKW